MYSPKVRDSRYIHILYSTRAHIVDSYLGTGTGGGSGGGRIYGDLCGLFQKPLSDDGPLLQQPAALLSRSSAFTPSRR